jgi:hypothetical protein
MLIGIQRGVDREDACLQRRRRCSVQFEEDSLVRENPIGGDAGEVHKGFPHTSRMTALRAVLA